MKERYNIKITDIQLTILSDEPEDFVYTTVAQLDERVRDLTVQNKRCSKLDAALLCALDSLGEKIKGEKKIKNLEAQISLYEATNKRLREELEAVRAGIAAPAAMQTAPSGPPVPAEEVTVEEAPAAEEPKALAQQSVEDTPAKEPAAEEAPAAEIPESQAAPEKAPEEAPAEEKSEEPAAEEQAEAVDEAPAAIHDAKLRQIEELLRRRSEENATHPAEHSDAPRPAAEAPRSASVSRDDKLRQIEDLLRKNGGSKSLSEALHDAIGN